MTLCIHLPQQTRRSSDLQRLDSQLQHFSELLLKTEDKTQESFRQFEDQLQQQRAELVSRDDDLWSNISVDRIALQKQESGLQVVNVEMAKEAERGRVDLAGVKEAMEKLVENR